MIENQYTIEPIGVIHSTLTNLADAPMQGDEGGRDAWLELSSQVAEGLAGIEVGDHLMVLTWLHLARRDVLQVHPRDDLGRPLTGVFVTRSSDRPNPIGLHRVTVLKITPQSLKVGPIEAVDGTPIVDIKPVLSQFDERWRIKVWQAGRNSHSRLRNWPPLARLVLTVAWPIWAHCAQMAALACIR